MNAHLIAYQPDGRGETSEASVQFNSTYVIQLNINNKKYQFDYQGNLLNQTEVQGCAIIVDNRGCCATLNNSGYCLPTEFKTED